MFGIHPILSPVGLSDTQVNVFFFPPHTVYIGSGSKPEGRSSFGIQVLVWMILKLKDSFS